MIIGYYLLLFIYSLAHQQSISPPTKYSILKQFSITSQNPPLIQQSIDGESILVGSDNTVFIYNNKIKPKSNQNKQRRVKQFQYQAFGNWTDNKNNITAIGGSHDIGVFAVAGTDNKLKIYEKIAGKLQNYRVIQTIQDAEASITHILFIANDQILVVASLDGNIHIYWKEKVKSQVDMTQTRKSITKNEIEDTTSSKQTSESEKQTIPILFEYKLIQTIQSRNKVESIAHASNNTMLYIGFSNRSFTAHKFTPDIKYQFFYLIDGFVENIRSIAINEAGNILAIGSGNAVIIYKSDAFGLNPQPYQGIYDANSSINKITMRRDGGVLVATSTDGQTRAYNFYSGKYLLNDTWSAQSGPKHSNSLSIEGDILVLSGKNKIVIYQSCISSIAKCSHCFSRTCSGCIDNYYLSQTGICLTCSLFQGCKTCITQNMCTSCFEGYFLNIEIGVCESCTNSLSNCKSCSSRYACTQCFLEFDLINQICEFPFNPNIPIPVPFNNSIKVLPPSDDIESDITHKWMITLIVLIIVLCVLIIVMLIAMTVLCLKLFNKLNSVPLKPKIIYAKGMEPIPASSERNILYKNEMRDDVGQLKQPNQKIILQPVKVKQNTVPIPLEHEQKEADPFSALRP